MCAKCDKFKVTDKETLTCVKIYLLYIGIFVHNSFKAQSHSEIAFAPKFIISVISIGEVIINGFNVNLFLMIFDNIKEFCNVVFVCMR